MQNQRRDFLKMTAAGAAGLALARAGKAHAAWPSTGTLDVNPTISNMRVVACYDTKMMTGTPTAMSFAAENAAVNTAQVQANMDAMAMQLANQTTADAAWKAIFRSSKAWASTKVAIKVNTIEPKNMARLAVIQKFCTILTGFGVPAANIIIYDGNTTYGAGISNYNSYFSATDTSKIPGVVSSYNTALGGTVNATIPGGTSAACTAQIANGTIDILINIANNKGHTMMGKATLSMKNHFGTFAPNHDNNYVFNINKSDAILGGTPVRQQLCFIDSLIANKVSNTGTPEVMPCYLIMGVFGPAVDYLTVKKVRETVMNCTHDETIIAQYVTTFGYAETDPVWVVVPPAGASITTDGGTPGTGGSASGGNSGKGGAGSGGSSGSSGTGGAGSGGARASGGAANGGASGSGGSGNGGASASGTGGAESGGTRASGGASSGGVGANGGAGSGGVSANGGAGSGGATASGGAPGNGGATSGTFATGGNAGGATTSPILASGGSAATGGYNAGNGVTGSSGSGCDVVGFGRRTSPWGALLAFGAVAAGKLWRRASRMESGEEKAGTEKTD